MNSLDIIKKHLTPDIPFKIKNADGTEDTIMLKCLNIGEQAMCFNIAKKLQGTKPGEEMEKIDDKTIKEMFDLFSSIVSRSVLGLDDSTLENFVLTNFGELADILEKLIPKSENQEKIEIIKKRFEQQRAAGEKHE